MTEPRPAHATRRALALVCVALAAGAAAAALPRPAAARTELPALAAPDTVAQDSARLGDLALAVSVLDGRAVAIRSSGATGQGPAIQPPKEMADSALFVVDGREAGRGLASIGALPHDSIASVNVLKGESARRAYGDRGRQGVVEITTKAKARSR